MGALACIGRMICLAYNIPSHSRLAFEDGRRINWQGRETFALEPVREQLGRLAFQRRSRAMKIKKQAAAVLAFLTSVASLSLIAQAQYTSRPSQKDDAAPLNYETIVSRLEAYRGREVSVEGDVVSIRNIGKGVLLTIRGGRRA